MSWRDMITLLALFAGIFGTICFCVWQDRENDRVAMEAGLEQQTLPGEEGVFWVKVKEPINLEEKK